jgi:hypothetical protein
LGAPAILHVFLLKVPAMRKLILTSALAVLTTAPVASQTLHCATREAVLRHLSSQGQSRHAVGLAGQAVMETFVNSDSGAWTITISLADGRTCLLANGQGWEQRDDHLPASGRPT